MATVTLANLRANIGRRTQQPFFMRLWSAKAASAGGSTTTLVDTVNLKQADDFWNGQWIYFPTLTTAREISDFVQSTGTVTWLEPLTSATTVGLAYEIWSEFHPQLVVDAVNQVLRDAWPYFFDAREAFVVLEDDEGASYDLTALSPVPRYLAQLWLEHAGTSYTGQVSSTPGAQNRLVDSSANFTSDDVGREVRIYAGTSAGDRRTISTLISSTEVEVSVNFTTTLATDSKYRVVEVNDNLYGFEPMFEWTTDRFSDPQTLRLGAHPWGFEGFLLRLLYEAEYTTLSAEDDTTTAPQEWLELATLSRLYASMISAAPASELKNWIAQQQMYAEAAQSFMLRHGYQHLASQIRDGNMSTRFAAEYPFR